MSILYIQQLPETDNPSHSSRNSLFYGDIVSRSVNNKIEFGKVLYPCHIPPDFDYDLETSLKCGWDKVDVMWLYSGHIEAISTIDSNVILHYRHFVPGMRAKKKHTGNYGRVLSVKQEFVVRIVGTDQVIMHVDPDCLVPLKKCNVSDYVQLQEWIGVVTSIHFEAHLTVFDKELQCSFTWEETPEDSLEPSKTNSLRHRIKYAGQILSMSYKEAMKELHWPCHSIFYGPWRAWQNGELVVKVLALVPTYTIEWLNRIPCSFHHQTDKPSNQVEDSNPNLLVFQRKPTSHIEIGSFWKLRSSDPSTWEYSNFSEWQSRFMTDSEEMTNPRSPNENTSLELWDMLRSVKSTMGINHEVHGDNSGLVVEILSFESWVTLVDPFKGGNISYVKSTELEPLLLTGPDDMLPLGTVVTAANGASSLAYYGVVSAYDDSGPAMWINWFKFEDYELNYLDRTSVSPNGDVVPHPDFRLKIGQILYSPEPIPLDSLRALAGILEKVGDDGLLHVRDPQNQMHKVFLHAMKPFPWRLSYDLGESSWRLTHTKRHAHVPLSGCCGESFSPALEVIADGSGESFPTVSRFLHEWHSSSKPQMSYSEFDVEIKNFHSLEATIADLRLYTGTMEPKIYLKFAAAAANQIHAVIEGPKDSLYEDFLLFFTIGLPPSFPVDPPVFHYHSFSTGKVNPCFKTNGEVLFPLLNTYPKFPGLHQERWDFEEHSLGLVLAAIQKILLCAVPYQHERKFPLMKLISSAITNRHCLEANERYVENIIESVKNQIQNPLDCWKEETLSYYKVHLPRLHNRLVASISRGKRKDCITDIPLPDIKFDHKKQLLRELRNLTCLYKDLFD